MRTNFGLYTLAIILALSAIAPPNSTAQDTQPSGLDFKWVTLGSNITQITTGARFTHNDWYSETTMGGFSAFKHRENAFFLGLNLGYQIPLNDWLYLGTDVGYRHIMPSDSHNPRIYTNNYYTLDIRMKLEVILGKHLTVFIGGATTNIYREYSSDSPSTNEGSIFWGVGLL